ncbi:MAG: tetratricopeptide repeat protein [Sulfurimonas sp.]|nr:tetratricopeptide repeat protein [Sulfurimonas sp.]
MKKLIVILSVFVSLLTASTYASFMTGIFAFRDKDYNKSLPAFIEAAEGGEAKAYSYIGLQYLKGYGTKKDVSKALEFYTKGANLDDESSIFGIGDMYFRADGVAKDYAKAVYWYEKVYNRNLVAPQLGAIYFDGGHGVKMNKLKSYQYWNDCARFKSTNELDDIAISNCQTNLSTLCKNYSWACK